MKRFYAGIGSRETPADVAEKMVKIGKILGERGYILRSGGAEGADLAFEKGADAASETLGVQITKEIILPWPGYNGHHRDREVVLIAREPSAGAMLLASLIHPAWGGLNIGSRKMHARNIYQILGVDLDAPCDFVICWTKDGVESAAATSANTGGTGQAIRTASLVGIPVFNMKRDDALIRLASFTGLNLSV